MRTASVLLVGLTAVSALAWTDGVPIGSNHTFSGASPVSSGDLSSGIMDLPGATEAQDDEAELSGEILNRTRTVRVDGLAIWFEDRSGERLSTPGGEGPVSKLRTGSSASNLGDVQLVRRAGGVSTFNIADGGIPKGGFHVYEADVDHFAEPNNFKIRMSYSTQRASKHFEAAGEAAFDRVSTRRLFDVTAPTVRTGVVLGIINHETSMDLRRANVVMISNDASVELIGGTVLNDRGQPISGARVQVTGPHRASVTGLSVSNPGHVTVWLDLNQPYTAETAFRVTVDY